MQKVQTVTIVELKSRSSRGEVRFELFGRFRIYVDDEEVETQDTAFYTYLKLLLLSGQTFLDNTRSCQLWVSAKAIRDLVDKGNGSPRRFQGGRFDFTADTGVSLKYREGYGLELQGAPWRNDVKDFEEVGKAAPKKSTEELREALDLYREGVDFQSWKKDRITIDCKDWIENRLEVLKKLREDIQAELDNRADSGELARDGSIGTAFGEVPEGWSEEGGVPHVISGLESRSAEAESDDIVSPVLREPLRQDDSMSEQVQEAMIDETADDDGSQPQNGAEGESMTIPSGDSSYQLSEPKSEIEKSPPTPSGRVTEPPARRTVTALGIVITVVSILLIFAIGYMIGGGPAAPTQPQDQGSPQNNLGSKPEVGTSGGTTLPSDDPGEEQPIVRAPVNPVSLNDLFLQNIGKAGYRYEEEDVVVARQLFPHYLSATSARNETAPAYKLDGQFQTVTCIVGVSDRAERYFESDRGGVLFEGDGKILKRLEVKPGQAVPVSLEVTDIKVLIISFSYPVVIASPKAHR